MRFLQQCSHNIYKNLELSNYTFDLLKIVKNIFCIVVSKWTARSKTHKDDESFFAVFWFYKLKKFQSQLCSASELKNERIWSKLAGARTHEKLV